MTPELITALAEEAVKECATDNLFRRHLPDAVEYIYFKAVRDGRTPWMVTGFDRMLELRAVNKAAKQRRATQ